MAILRAIRLIDACVGYARAQATKLTKCQKKEAKKGKRAIKKRISLVGYDIFLLSLIVLQRDQIPPK